MYQKSKERNLLYSNGEQKLPADNLKRENPNDLKWPFHWELLKKNKSIKQLGNYYCWSSLLNDLHVYFISLQTQTKQQNGNNESNTSTTTANENNNRNWDFFLIQYIAKNREKAQWLPVK